MHEQQLSVDEIFGEAFALDSAGEQAAYLDAACAGLPALRQRVEKLLAAYPQAKSFLEKPALDSETTAIHGAAAIGTQIGHYKLLELIGEGGMGLVYMAEQQQPVRRLVALKLIKPGMDSAQVIARFEAERQALAMMDHPGIARILEAGTVGQKDEGGRTKDEPGTNSSFSLRTSSLATAGRPYFVMELVRGIPITEFCDHKQLSVRERLELFIQVCQAVQHAHQKGVIHRDLKPTNVLVTMHDSVAVPKIIDFGIAKALTPTRSVSEGGPIRLTDHTLHTGFAQMIGTPLYMSPEQAEMNQFGVDTRSDVYSLGVLLYELLTGATPFDKDTLKDAGFDELRRIIREVEPPRPSARVSTLAAETRSTISQRRGVDPRRIAVALRGELDWIVMRALEKDRSRRYESASALAADIERYLTGEVVQACPPSAAYRLRTVIRQHRLALTTAAIVALTLVVGTGVSIWQAVRATHAETRATSIAAAARLHERQALAAAAAERAARVAEAAQRQRAEEQTQIVEGQRQLLENNERIHTLVTNELLAVVRDVPTSVAKRHALLVTALGRLDDLEPAERVTALQSVGNNLVMLNDVPGAIRIFDEGLLLDPGHVGILVSRGDALFRQREFERAIGDYTAAIEHRRSNDPANLLPFERRGFAHCRLGRYDQALTDFRAGYAESPARSLAFLTLGLRGAQAIQAPFHERLSAGMYELFDQYIADHRRAPAAVQFVADSLAELGEYEGARVRLESVQDADPWNSNTHYQLSLLALRRGDEDEYRRICRATLAQIVAAGGKDPATDVQSAIVFGLRAGGLDDYATAIEFSRRMLARESGSAFRRFLLGALLYRAGQYEEALQRLQASLETRHDSNGQNVFAPFYLAMTYHQLGRADEAHKWLKIGTERAATDAHINWRFSSIVKLNGREARDLITGGDEPAPQLPRKRPEF